MINSIIYNIKEGAKGILRNPTMAIASVGSVAASLFILGIIFSIVLNINNFTVLIKGQFDNVQVYLEEGLSSQDIFNLKKEIKKVDGVKDVTFESKEDALNKMKKRWGKESYLLEGLDNPLQNSYIIEVNELQDISKVAEKIKKYDGIEEVKYYKDVVEKLMKISNLVKTSGIFIIGLLVALSLFIISNTIKLALHSRKKEINIMKYIGATDWFIRGPFIVEGIILGSLGGILALSITYFGYNYFYNKLNMPSYSIFSGYVLPISSIINSLILIFMVMGVGIGIIGSVISLRRYLKV
ncbi:permease-like cell division protein FtsX [Tepidibacter formicigenes]|jgi:cell division transport system permease protein|uniref:Cell division protein FtsX n=1 Tax=Tepidibacter formicigenes DSM 15518 TaxID=1123349 RepID=A0A1M6SYS2_9FIRM|nr:permease-like cell division protein FtsX [Tepidibacter formicigenes]SHK49863.1 cell division protein FtsX [Tepidibacter formicigenes DSM 15518]